MMTASMISWFHLFLLVIFIKHSVSFELSEQSIENAFNKARLFKTNKIELLQTVPLFRTSVKIEESAGFLNHLVLPENTIITACHVEVKGIVIDLRNRPTEINGRLDEVTRRVFSLDFGLCGLRFIDATVDFADAWWTLTAVADNGSSYTGRFASYIERKINTSIKEYVEIGQSHSLTCRRSGRRCSIYNPQGEIIENTNCTHFIKSIRVKDFGLWECHVISGNTMKPAVSTIELNLAAPMEVTGWINETDNYVAIGCDYPGEVSSCDMILPNGGAVNIVPGFATERYLSLQTDFRKSRCSMQIKKPLEELEKGAWRCELILVNNLMKGVPLIVGDKSSGYPKYKRVTARLDEPFDIKCEVPYPIDYCRITSPDSYSPFLLPDSEQELNLGRCSYRIDKFYNFSIGNWTCHIARKTGLPDDEIIIDVNIADILESSVSGNVSIGGTAELMCRTSGEIPLHYCRYTSPNKKNYHIRDSDSNTSGITYFGRGLKYGECGIRVPNISQNEIGNWICTVQLLPNDYKKVDKIITLR